MLFQKLGLITLIAAPKCSLKNPDKSPLQQPQNDLSTHELISQILTNDSLTSYLKCGLISSK